MQRRPPTDGILPHSLSPRKGTTSTEPPSAAATVGSSWMLRFDEREGAREHVVASTSPETNFLGSPGKLRHRQEHYGFNPTNHTNDRAVALA